MSSQAVRGQLEQCEEKAGLMDEYAAASDVYNQTVLALRNKLGTLPKAEYAQVRLASEGTRLRCDAARLALYRHIRDHGC